MNNTSEIIEKMANNLAQEIKEIDNKINCKNVEWDLSCPPIDNIKDGKLKMEYIPYCTINKKIINNIKDCKSCKLKENK